jgi:tetratricopeptide (TPR) repeat protein
MQATTITVRSGFTSLLLIASIVAFCGCGGKPSADPPPATPAAPGIQPAGVAPAAAEVREVPPSDAEAQAFAKSFEKTLASGNAVAINAAIDMDALARRAMSGIDLREDVRRRYINSVKADFAGPGGIASGLAQAVSQGEHYRLLHVHRQGDEQRAIFRRITVSGGEIDYYDFILLRDADGKVRICDIFEYRNGELDSDNIHRECMCTAAEASPEFLRKLSPSDRDYVIHESAVLQMRKLVAGQQFRQALDVYQGMPELVKNHSGVLQPRMIACCYAEGRFDEALRAYRAAVPADPGIDLVIKDYFFLHRQFDDSLACIERLDRAVGGDPALDAYRAAIYHQKGDLAAAKKCAQNAAVAEPNLELARVVLKAVAVFEKNLSADRPAGGPKLPDKSPGEPPSDAEARAFGEAFAKTVTSGDAAAVRAAVDGAACKRRAMAKLNCPEEIKVGVENALALAGDAGLANIFTAVQPQIGQGANFRLLHLRRIDGEQRALFRLVQPKGGITYFDCILVRHADGKVRIDDVYPFQLGEMMSETLRRLLSHAVEDTAKALQAASGAPTGDGVRFAAAWSEMEKLIKAGKYQEALDICRSFPERYQKEKDVLLARIRAARAFKGETYDDAVRAYRKAFPNEPNLDLIMIDAYYAHKLYDRVLASIDGLDRTVGGDPYLDALRGQAYLLKGDLAAAKRCARKSRAAEPDLPTAYLCLLKVSLKEKDFAETSALLTTIRDKFPRQMPTLEKNPDYAAYTASPQYRAWRNVKKP